MFNRARGSALATNRRPGHASKPRARPFLTVLAPSARYHAQRGHRHKTLTHWARQMPACLCYWRPNRELDVVAYRTDAVVRLDSALYAPPPPQKPGRRGHPRLKGARLPLLRQRLTDLDTIWMPLCVRGYDGHRVLDCATVTALRYSSGQPVVPLRRLRLRDPDGVLDKSRSQDGLCLPDTPGSRCQAVGTQ